MPGRITSGSVNGADQSFVLKQNGKIFVVMSVSRITIIKRQTKGEKLWNIQ